jgi:enamine deaminase RidA (YjgF/YER057c/UK114 family)
MIDMSIEEKLEKLGLKLPTAPQPAGTYIGAKQTGNLVYTASQGPFPTTKRGLVGRDLTTEEGYKAAKEACLNCLAQLKAVIGDLKRVKQVVQVVGMVNSDEGFTDLPKVLNGFTELLVELYAQDAGRPARAVMPIHHNAWPAVSAWMVVELK